MHYNYFLTYLSFDLSLVSLSVFNIYFCRPLSIDLKDKLLGVVVHDLNLSSLASLSLFLLNLDPSLSSLVINAAHFELWCHGNK